MENKNIEEQLKRKAIKYGLDYKDEHGHINYVKLCKDIILIQLDTYELFINNYKDEQGHINYGRICSDMIETNAYSIQYIEWDMNRPDILKGLKNVHIKMEKARLYKKIYKYIKLIKEIIKMTSFLNVPIQHVDDDIENIINKYM